jgi:hyperosmotically inducible periplasmic protein
LKIRSAGIKGKKPQKQSLDFLITALTEDPKMKLGKYLSTFGATLFLGASLLAGSVPQSGQQPAPDNTKNNQGDAGKDAMTADQQKMNPADRNTTKQIRKSIMQDQSLSTYAHNIKIITRDGKVTLKGPVRSEEDKASIEAKAVAVAGADNVTNQLEIAPKQ